LAELTRGWGFRVWRAPGVLVRAVPGLALAESAQPLLSCGRGLLRAFLHWPDACGLLLGFDMNQAAFARDLGISQAQLSRYEKGKSEMGAEVLLRISRRFGKSMEWVLTGEDP
jgi:DNA-binding XRE family transcriptional regulator